MNKTIQSSMLEALHAEGPAPAQARNMNLYGQLVGSWEGRLITRNFHVDERAEVQFDPPGTPMKESTLEIHFDWVLKGLVIQDIFIAPASQDGKPGGDLMYGTSIRVYDPKNDVWYVTFIDPITTQSYHRMVGRKVGNDIVQEYHTPEGKLVTWNFTEITADSFHWLWRETTDNGKTWDTPAEFFLHRRVEEPALV